MKSKYAVRKIATLEGHRDAIYTLALTNNPSELISAGGDGLVVKWDLENPKDGILLAQVKNSIYATLFIPETNQLIVAQNHEGIHCIDCITNKEIKSLFIANTSFYALYKQNNILFIGTGEGEVVCVDYQNFTKIKIIKLSDKNIRSLEIGPQNTLLAGSTDGNIYQINTTTLTLENTIQGHEGTVFSITKDDAFWYTVGKDAKLKQWNQNLELDMVIPAHLYAINHITYQQDRELLATCSLDKSIKIWETNPLKLVKVIDKGRHAGHGTSVNRLMWTNFKGILASCSDDRTLSLWEIYKEIM